MKIIIQMNNFSSNLFNSTAVVLGAATFLARPSPRLAIVELY